MLPSAFGTPFRQLLPQATTRFTSLFPLNTYLMSAHLSQLDLVSPKALYHSLVTLTHEFYFRYVTRSHTKRSHGAVPWTLDELILQTEWMDVEAGWLPDIWPTDIWPNEHLADEHLVKRTFGRRTFH